MAERDELFERWLALPPNDERTIVELAADEASGGCAHANDGVLGARPARIDTGFLKRSFYPRPDEVALAHAPTNCPTCGVGMQKLRAARLYAEMSTVIWYETCGHRHIITDSHVRDNDYKRPR